MTSFKIFFAIIFLFGASLSACSFSQTSKFDEIQITTYPSILDSKHGIGTKTTRSISGLFIGISNYNPEKNSEYSTAAHTISAALVYSVFSEGALNVNNSSTITQSSIFANELTLSTGDNNMTMLADLRASPLADKETMKNFIGSINKIQSTNRYLRNYNSDFSELKKDGTFGYFGKGEYVTKNRVMKAFLIARGFSP